MSIGRTRPRKNGGAGRELLFETDMDAAAAVVMAHGGDIGQSALRQRDGVIEPSHAGATEEGRHDDLAGPAPQLMPMLDFPGPKAPIAALAGNAAHRYAYWRYNMPHSIYEFTHPHMAKYMMALGIEALGDNQVTNVTNLGAPVSAAVTETRWSPPEAPDGDVD